MGRFPRAKAVILVVDDSADLRLALRDVLLRDRYECFVCADAAQAVKEAPRIDPDLFILDVSLPGVDGFELLRLLRRRSEAPALFLSAHAKIEDKVLGLTLGADDYMTKPFEVSELKARIEAILRRAGAGRPAPAPRGLALGRIEIDPARHEVRLSGRPLRLTSKEFELLKVLAEAGGAVLSRAELLERAWGFDGEGELDTRTVDQHVARLRRKLGTENARLVTVTGYGYRLNAD